MDENQGLNILNKFMDDAYHELENSEKINGIFFSDSGVLFYRENISNENEDILFKVLNELLKFIKKLNIKYITPSLKWGNVSLLTKCCVAFGEFKYQKKQEHTQILKGPVYGLGYIKAAMSVEKDPHKMEIGEVRILYDSLEKEIYSKFKNNTNYDEFKHFYQFSNDHMYYSWTYKKNPNKSLNRIRKEMETELEETKKRKMQEMFENQKQLYIKWVETLKREKLENESQK